MIKPQDQQDPLFDNGYLRAIFDASNDAIYVMDPTNGHVLDLNQRAIDTSVHSSREEAINRFIAEHRLAEEPHIKSDVVRLLAKAKQEGPQIFEWELRNLDGTLSPVEISLRLQSIGGRELAIAAVRDISERKAAADYFRAIFDASNDPMFIHDALSGDLVDFNLRAEEVYEISREQLASLNVEAISVNEVPYTQADALNWIQKTRTDGPQQFEWKSRKAVSGKVFDSEISMRAQIIDGHELIIASGRDITKSKEQERAVIESERRFKALVSNMPGSVYRCSAKNDFQTEFVSEGILDLCGYAPEALTSNEINWMDLVVPADRERFLSSVQQAVDQKEIFESEFRIITKAGKERWIWERGSAVYFEDGTPRFVDGLVIDVTERKAAESQLLENEERLRLALHAANQGLYDLNVQTGECTVSPEYPEMLGYDPSTFVETNAAWLERLHPDDAERVTQTYQDYVDGKTDEYRVEFRNRKADGSWIWLLSLGKIVECDATGQPLRMLGTHSDITARKASEEELRSSRQRLASHIENTPLATIEWDTDWNVVAWNPAAEHIFGYTRDEILGTPAVQIVPENTREHVQLMMSRMHSQMGGLRSTNTNITKEGRTLLCDWYNTILTDGNGNVTGVASLVMDITERAEKEKAVLESERKFKALVANLPGCAYRCRIDDVFSVDFVSEGVLNLCGYTADDFVSGRINWKDLVCPDDAQHAEEAIRQAIEQDKAYEIEFRTRTKNGDERWIWERGSVVYSTEGTAEYIEGFITDITERKQANALAQGTLNALSAHIAILDHEGTILAVNHSWERFAEQNNTPQDTVSVGTNYLSVCDGANGEHSEDAGEFAKGLRSVINGECDQFEMEYPCETELELLWFSVRITLFSGSEPRRVAVAHENITARKNAEIARKESEAKYKALLTNLPGMVYRCKNDADWSMKFVSEGSTSLTGYTPEELQQNTNFSFNDLIHPDDRSRTWDVVQAALETRCSYELEYRIQSKDGAERWVWERGCGHYSGDGTLLYLEGFITDISERKTLESAMEKRIVSLTRPLLEDHSVEFKDLFDLEDFQKMQDEFADATGVASLITLPDGTPLTQPSNFTRLCFEIIRGTEKGCANCLKSDAAIGYSTTGPTVQICLSGGLWDASAPIEVGGRHVANWLIGQVRDEAQTEEKMLAYAKEIGADETACLEAFRDVPVMKREQFEKVAKTLYTLASQLSNMAYQNVQQARLISDRRKNAEALIQSESEYRMLFENMTTGLAVMEMICDADDQPVDCRFLQINPAFEKLVEQKSEAVLGRTVHELLPGIESSWIEQFGHVAESGRPMLFEDYTAVLDKYFEVHVFSPEPGIIAVIFTDTTERRRHAQALAESEKRFRGMLENTPHLAVQGLNEDGLIHYWNKGSEATYGYSAAEAIGQNLAELILPPDLRADFTDAIKHGTLTGEVPPPTEHELVRKDGSLVNILASHVINRQPGKTFEMFCLDVDVSALKKAEQQLQHLNEVQSLILDNSSMGIALVRNRTFEWVNPRLGELFMIPQDLLQGASTRILYSSEQDYEEIGGALYQQVLEGKRADQAVEFLRQDGSQFWCRLVGKALNPDAPEEGLLWMFEDITERKENEIKLAASEAQLRNYIDNAPYGLFIADRSGNLVGVNPAASEMSGYTKDELLSMTIMDLHPPEKGRQQSADTFEAVQNIGHATSELPFQKKNGDTCTWIIRGCTLPNGHILGFAEDITQRIETDAALVESEKKRRDWLANSPVCTKVLDLDFNLQYMSDAGVRALQIGDVTQLYGKPYPFSFFPESFNESMRTDLQKVKETGESLKNEGCVVGPNGNDIWFNAAITPVKDDQGKLEYIMVISSDITERRKAEIAVEESQQLLRSIIDTIPTRVFWKDLDSVYIGGNKAFAGDTEVDDPLRLQGLTDFDMVWKTEQALAFRRDDLSVITDGQPKLNFEEYQKQSDGTDHWLRTSKIPLRDMHGTITGVLGTYEDITEKKQIEIELLRLSTAIEQSPESVVITDTEGHIEYVNPAFTHTTGYTREEAIGQNPRILKSEDQAPDFYDTLWSTISAGEVWSGQLTNKRKNNELYIEEATISPVHDSLGRITNYVAVKRDITDELEREESFRQSQKMEAVGQLAGGVAHDFNNILQAVLGFSEILLLRLEKDSQEHRNVQEIHKSAKRAAELTKQLLAFSRKQPAEHVVLNLNDAVCDSEVLLQMLLGERFDIELELFNDLPVIRADHGQISQLIMNLAVNARDAMPQGGQLTIATKPASPDQVEQENRTGSYACLSITDTGCGMTEETKDRLFEPFFTTKDIGKGTGLGLSVVYGIIQQSKGWIHVNSEIDQGTTFEIYLPAVEQSPDENGGSKNALKILLVEDNDEVRELMLRLLEKADHTVAAFANAEDALAYYQTDPSAVKLLFTDLILPKQNGILLADTIRKSNPAMPVLLCSGHSDQKQIWQNQKQKNYHFIEKPITVTGLLSAVSKALNATHK